MDLLFESLFFCETLGTCLVIEAVLFGKRICMHWLELVDRQKTICFREIWADYEVLVGCTCGRCFAA